MYLYNTKVRQNKPVLDTETLREIGVSLCHFARRLSGVWPMGWCSPAWFIRAGPGSSSLLSGTEQARSGGFKAEPVWWTLRWSKQQVHVVFCSALLKWEPPQGVTDLYHRHWFLFFFNKGAESLKEFIQSAGWDCEFSKGTNYTEENQWRSTQTFCVNSLCFLYLFVHIYVCTSYVTPVLVSRCIIFLFL